MENTGKVLFGDETPQWYIALGERWVGPLSAGDVYKKVLSQEITWAHFVWTPGQADWKRICDVKTFQGAVPVIPHKAVQQEVKVAAKPAVRTTASKAAGRAPAPPVERAKVPVEERSWFLYYNDTQYGPFSTEEISRFLQVGKLHGRVHIWKDGMSDWVRLESLELFSDDVSASKKVRDQKKSGDKAAASPKELRSAPRSPLVAKILMANQESVIVAVCRDISIGGMQVLTDRIPGAAGSRIKMNVSPAAKLEPFVAEGVIVRILEDGRGFSFRFEKLPENSKRAIESYIHANAD